MKHVQACLVPGKIKKAVFTTVESCEARASLFICGDEKDLTKQFYPPRRCYEARVGLFKCLERSTKQFSPLRRSCEARASLFMCGDNMVKPF